MTLWSGYLEPGKEDKEIAMKTELTEFMKMLNSNKKNLTRQQFRTVKGQAFAGDIVGARKGLVKLLERRCR